MFDPLKTKTKVVVYSTITFLLGVGLASGAGWTDTSLAELSLGAGPEIDARVVQPALDLSDAFVEIAEAVTPGVVRIETSRTVPVVEPPIGPRAPNPDGSPLDFFNPNPPPPRIAGGTGFIVTDDGYILTNDHVVSGADEITVFLHDGRMTRATLVGTDPFTDVATIRIDEPDLTPISLGSSEELRVGEWVMAVGNPGYGGGTRLDYSVTAGIVSAKGRPLQIIQNGLRQAQNENSAWAIEDFIQTDAVVNPGNSGGPLVDLAGDVIGINSAIASTTGYFQGYSFAIPIDLATRVMEDLVAYGHVKRPQLGVQVRAMNADFADAFDLPTVSGVFVQIVVPEGPAAGILQANDVILEVDGKPVGRVGQLQAEVAKRRPGDEITLRIFRDGRARSVSVELDEAPLNEVVETVVEEVSTEEPVARLGFAVDELNEATAARFGLEPAGGVVVTEVTVGGPADRGGLFAGLRILSIRGVPVETVEDVGRILEGLESGDAVAFRVIRPQDGTEATEIVRVRD